MTLVLLLIVPCITGLLCLWAPSRSWAQGISYAGLLVTLGIAVMLGTSFADVALFKPWLVELQIPWIPSWHVSFHLGVDPFAYWLIILALLLGLCAVFIGQPRRRIGSYFASINWAVFGVLGLFLSADLFLFFVFWELALLPIYWILIVDGEKIELRQTLRFIILTQASGLFLLIGIVGLVYLNAQASGEFTFDYSALARVVLSPDAQFWLMLCFVLAFLIKLPAVPFHGWMPALFSEGPAAAVLVAILVKTSVFGLVRFSWTVFPEASAKLAMPLMILGVITLLYGAILAFGQSEPRRIVAYGTLSHAGLLLIGIFCAHDAGFYGVLMLLSASALSTAVMLMMFDLRRETGFLDATGLWSSHPKFSVVLLIMALASMGFPLFGNFLGEWLILWSLFAENFVVAIVASIGVVLSAAYSLRLFQRLCLGVKVSPATLTNARVPDLKPTELVFYGTIAILIVGLGLSPARAMQHVTTPFADVRLPTSFQEVLSNDNSQVVVP